MSIKNQQQILKKLGIQQLNPMQEATAVAIQSARHVMLLSPTGTGKTLAFLLPIIAELDPEESKVQVLIIVPSRELALQIEQVVREMGSGYKVNAIYGGRSGGKDKLDLKTPPAILIGTPGRLADRIRRRDIDTSQINTLVLDEFDKSLEVGFDEEMIEITQAVRRVRKIVLTSATQGVEVPSFVNFKQPKIVDFLGQKSNNLTLKRVISPEKDKAKTLIQLLRNVGDQPGIIFCNYKDTISYLSEHLEAEGIGHATFYGGMEQIDRERSLVKFRNKSHQLLLATDLAARGLDIPELGFIIHYQLPHREEEFTHRNGRTARMHSSGVAYLIQWEAESLPEFIQKVDTYKPGAGQDISAPVWKTLFVSGGRKDKISKGDLAGTFIKQGKLDRDDVGVIEVKHDCAFVAVTAKKAAQIAKTLNNTRIKKKKVRVSVL
ncbi:DEAD/DEAH box helicase [Marinoscillum furvescens]|uniref:Superfamily II DNA/RNA helicase n=1 Tax=Marinoscillum furvescens DSM 4134 TaxID=1122208 RepID=A0A3D9KWA8_MARFU|nr:DEAD/DEAH box helicase [Marinoscillum furvescens]RED92224.1 superfamily II DNA/RNA helicase [Marinoscillum furvescens DSM 4134]